jgi:hypothetical protein
MTKYPGNRSIATGIIILLCLLIVGCVFTVLKIGDGGGAVACIFFLFLTIVGLIQFTGGIEAFTKNKWAGTTTPLSDLRPGQAFVVDKIINEELHLILVRKEATEDSKIVELTGVLGTESLQPGVKFSLVQGKIYTVPPVTQKTPAS